MTSISGRKAISHERIVEGASRVVGRLVQPRGGGLPRQSRPQRVDHLFAVQPPVAQTSSHNSSTRDRILIAAGALVLLCAAAVVVLYRRWR